MRQCARGLLAVLGGSLLTVGLVGGAMSAPGAEEIDAIYEFREQLVEALREAKGELQEYRAYRDDPRWYVVEGGWGYVDVERLEDYAPIAQYVEDHPGSFDVLSTQPFWLDAPLVASVSLLIDEAASSADVPRAAEALAASLIQTADEKAPDVRPLIQYAREERELTLTAIDTLDAMLEQMGLAVPGPSADDIEADPSSVADGTSGVMAAFRTEVEEDLAAMRQRIRDCRTWIDDRDAYIHDDFGTAGFDLARLADYETAVEFIREHVWARSVLDAPAARDSALDIATDLYLNTFEDPPDDLGEITAAVVKAKRQKTKQKRNACVEILGTGKRHRDALAAALALTDQITDSLGLVLAPTPAPTLLPTPTPTLEPEPTPVPTPVPLETPAPDPFADL